MVDAHTRYQSNRYLASVALLVDSVEVEWDFLESPRRKKEADIEEKVEEKKGKFHYIVRIYQ